MNLFAPWMLSVICVVDFVLGETILDDITKLRPWRRGNVEDLSKWESAHGYVQVRPGAHLFYWLFYANGTKVKANEKPVVIWIQGGPGFAASGIGNFAEIGPLTMDMLPRNHTWVKERNVLFIDHPVDTGFSYATDDSLLVSTDREMAMDLAKTIKVFYRRYKEFRKTPTYLFSQSYGGKICPRLALYLHTAIERKKLKMNFKGIGIGGGWVNPRESTAMQPNFLYLSGAIDRNLYLTSMKIARKLVRSLDTNQYHTADTLDYDLYNTLNSEERINFNNVQAPSPYPALERLNKKMNLFIKPTLASVNQSIQWEFMSTKAYYKLQSCFLVPSTYFLETLLNTTNLKIAIYNGNLDVVTPLAGASNWVHKLNWPGAADFALAKRYPIKGLRNGFYKVTGRLSFWSVFGAGHWVPEENPEAIGQILDYVMSDDR